MKTYVYADQKSKLRKIDIGDLVETEKLKKNPENNAISNRNNFIDAHAITDDKKDINTFDDESNDDKNDKMFNEIEQLVEKIDFSSSKRKLQFEDNKRRRRSSTGTIKPPFRSIPDFQFKSLTNYRIQYPRNTS